MSAAGDAYTAALKKIEEARVSGADRISFDRLETHSLKVIPPEIAALSDLSNIDLDNTKVSDLSPLSGLTGLTELSLYGTSVSDLSPLSGLTGLTRLSLYGTSVSDLSPLSGLTDLMQLWLNETSVSDLSPLSGLTGLTDLRLYGTSVSDLSPLSGLTGLTQLWLNETPVSDLSPLSGLTGLTELWLGKTSASDLSPLSGLTGLTQLWLNGTSVSDLSPLSGLTGLTWLSLSETSVSDLSPLSGLERLERLYLNKTDVSELAPLSKLANLHGLYLAETQVTSVAALSKLVQLDGLHLTGCPIVDLRPLMGLRQLVDAPSSLGGLQIENCAATRVDEKIAEISEIEDASDRARALFDYLETWEPPVDVLAPVDALAQDTTLPASIPVARLAPLQADVFEGRLRRVGAHGLPQADANARAEAGWRSLKVFLDTYRKACNVHNYSQLAAFLDAFDAALGDAFDPDQVILIGTMGHAIIAFSKNQNFLEELPIAANTLLVQFGVQIELFLNRFPDWVSYVEDAQNLSVDVGSVAAENASFREFETTLRESPETDRDVVESYALQVSAGTHPESDKGAAVGVVASTREVVRALSEKAVQETKSGHIARAEIDELDKVHSTELAKVKWYAGGFAIVILRNREKTLRRLARRFPSQLGWVEAVLDYIGAPRSSEIPKPTAKP